MTTTLDTSCSENTMVLSAGEGFCMHVFSSIQQIYQQTQTIDKKDIVFSIVVNTITII